MWEMSVCTRVCEHVHVGVYECVVYLSVCACVHVYACDCVSAMCVLTHF